MADAPPRRDAFGAALHWACLTLPPNASSEDIVRAVMRASGSLNPADRSELVRKLQWLREEPRPCWSAQHTWNWLAAASRPELPTLLTITVEGDRAA
jgi:hypothetical protein